MLNTEHLERERSQLSILVFPYNSICSSTDECKLITLTKTSRYLVHLVTGKETFKLATKKPQEFFRTWSLLVLFKSKGGDFHFVFKKDLKSTFVLCVYFVHQIPTQHNIYMPCHNQLN